MASAADAPKGIFPFYAPGGHGFLATFPVSANTIELPESEQPLNLQIEPEAGVLCDVSYADGQVDGLAPVAVAAFNDCSIRRPGARRISEKKNWGPNSKGFAERAFELDEIERDGAAAQLRLASFLRRDGELHEYGIDSPLPGYSYFGTQLLSWIIGRLNTQSDDGPLEDVGAMLRDCGSPAQLLVGIGATRYTSFGETNFLAPGDESIVAVYDGGIHSAADLQDALSARRESELSRASVLVQLVRGSSGP